MWLVSNLIKILGNIFYRLNRHKQFMLFIENCVWELKPCAPEKVTQREAEQVFFLFKQIKKINPKKF